jgi:hypothetical protein
MKILNRLPYAAAPTTETVRGESLTVKPFQIVMWVSIGIREIVAWDPRTPRLPAVLDTGNNHHFSISSTHLGRWAGIQPAALPRLREIRDRGKRITLHAARLWLHPNIPGERQVAAAEPVGLNIDEGIALYPDEAAPRLPVLGLRALTVNKLHLMVDAERRLVQLRTPDWRTKLLRWL